MNIWFLNHYAGSVEFGMEFRHYYFAKELCAMGHNVSIFAGSFSHLRKYNPEVKGKYSVEIHEGIRYVWIPTCRYVGNGKDRVLSMLQYYRGAIEIAKYFDRPDIILSSSPHLQACLAGIKISKKLNCKSISEVRDLWPEALIYYKGLSPISPIVKLMEYYEHKIYRNSDALVFTKPGDVDYLREKGWLVSNGGDVLDTKCHYLNNGVDINTFRNQIRDCVFEPIQGDSCKKFYVTYVGTIREVNNIDMLLDAAKIINLQNVIFRIFGDGEELGRLKERKRVENIDNVVFYGRIDKQFVPYVLSKSSVNILNYSPHLYNWNRGNSSNKLFEYMACGKPIISTVKMGYSPLKEYQCGIEIDDCNGEKIANEIIKLMDMSDEDINTMGQNAYLAANQFDYKVLSKELMRIILKTIEGEDE